MALRYTNEIVIDCPLEQVASVFSDKDQIGDWQRGFVSLKVTSGLPGANGSTAELLYLNRGKEMTMTETITDNGLPHHFHGRYDMPSIRNVQRNFFEALNDGSTRWRSETEFQFAHWSMRILGRCMPGMFRNTSQRFMDDFKDWIENGVSARTKPH